MKEIGPNVRHSSAAFQSDKIPTEDLLPSWIADSTYFNPSQEETAIKHIPLHDSVMGAVNNISLNDLSSMYGYFSMLAWSLYKKQLSWKGQVMYKKMTPPWLLGNIVFLHDPNQSSPISFQHKHLPRKSDLREKGQKIIGRLSFLHGSSLKKKHHKHFNCTCLRNELCYIFPS